MKFFPLFADMKVEDVVAIILTFGAAVVAGLMKLFSMMNQPAPKPRPDLPPPPQPHPAPRDALSNEIDEFLRRAAQKKPRGQAAGPRRQPVITLKEAAERPMQAEVVGARPVGGGLDKHLQQFAREKKEFEQRAARLGDEVALADDKIEAHLKEKFTHRLGKLERRSDEPAAPPGPAEVLIPHVPLAAAGFAALLSGADNLRQAVVLSEIFQRPVGRWE